MNLTLNEVQWLGWKGEPSRELVDFAGRAVSQRKIRLFYCGCVRRVWPMLKDARSRAAVEASELFADGRLSAEQLLEARKTGYSAWYECPSQITSSEDNAAAAAFMCANDDLAYASGVPGRVAGATGNEAAEYEAQAALLRDVVGNPFHPLGAGEGDALRQVEAVYSLASTIYEQRQFQLVPRLADLMEQQANPHSSILQHCREPAEHVRGCWVVDLILGKT